MNPALAWMLVAAGGLWVAPSPDAAALAALLAEELGPAALVPEADAELRVRVEARDGALYLEVRAAADGATLVERRLEASAERSAVLRSAVLVIAQVVSRTARGEARGEARGAEAGGADAVVEARGPPGAALVRASASDPARAPASPLERVAGAERAPAPGTEGAPAPTPEADRDRSPGRGGAPELARAPALDRAADAPPIAEPRGDRGIPLALWIGAGPSLALAGGAPQLGVELAARAAGDDGAAVWFGASVGLDGLGCCVLSSALASGGEGLSADRMRARALASVSWRAWSSGLVALELEGGAGLHWQRLTTRAVAFLGSAPAVEAEAWSPLGRAAVRVRGPLAGSRLGWAAEVGVEVGGALSSELPVGFPGRGEAIDTGFISPVAQLRLEWRAL